MVEPKNAGSRNLLLTLRIAHLKFALRKQGTSDQRIDETIEEFLTAEDERGRGQDTDRIARVARLADLILPPDDADEEIGDLTERYRRRLAVDARHAKWWLRARAIGIVFRWALDVVRKVAAARMGK